MEEVVAAESLGSAMQDQDIVDDNIRHDNDDGSPKRSSIPRDKVHSSRRVSMCRVRSIDNIDAIDHIKFVDVHLNDTFLSSSLYKIINKHQKNTEREREIFLRAAFQLLESSKSSNNSSIEQNGHSLTYSGQDMYGNNSKPTHKNATQLHSAIRKNHFSPDVKSDVVRYGFLRKINQKTLTSWINARSDGSAPFKLSYKSKYIELRYGFFSYESDMSTKTQISLNWVDNNHSTAFSHVSNNSARKEFQLVADCCECRPSQYCNRNNIFEMVINGVSRLWMTNDQAERDDWIYIINKAMIGNLDSKLGLRKKLRLSVAIRQLDVSLLSPSNSGSGFTPQPRNHQLSHSSEHDVNELLDIGSSNSSLQSVQSLQSASHPHHSKKSLTIDGPASQYLNEIGKFVSIQAAVKLATEASDYCSVLSKLYRNKLSITIPVYYVKNFSSHSNFAISSKDVLTQESLQHIETSQIWKDLQRDSVKINGEEVVGEASTNAGVSYGGTGTEAMVGCLMRHIMDTVETIRCLGADMNGDNAEILRKPSRFVITESQALACARDILMLCNRTQSGGDSYFCISSLFFDRSKDLCVIAPLSADAEPITINVDVVRECSTQSSTNLVASPPRESFFQNASGSIQNSFQHVRRFSETMLSPIASNKPFQSPPVTKSSNTETPSIRSSLTQLFPIDASDENSIECDEGTDDENSYVSSQLCAMKLDTSDGDKDEQDTQCQSTRHSTSQTTGKPSFFKSIYESFTPRHSFLTNQTNQAQMQVVNPEDLQSDSADYEEISPKGCTTPNAAICNNDFEANGEYCIRITVSVTSHYRICDANPQDEITSVWSKVKAKFHQLFFLKSGGEGRPVVSDRLVTIQVEDINQYLGD